VPEFEARRTPVPPFAPLRRDDDARDGIDPPPPGAPQREGLPPGFQMRHDAHYVDQLTARGTPPPHIRIVPIREIDGPRAAELHDLEPLVRSIARHGVLQPLLVRARHGRFELMAGARRLRAAALAGLPAVPCLVHTCDDDRARALKEAAALGRAPAPAPAARPAGDLASGTLGELRRSFGTIGSCLHLLVERDATLRDRVALDLVRTEAHRAHRLVQAIHVLTQDPPIASGPVPLRSLVMQVLDAFEPERRLSATQVSIEGGDAAGEVWADPEWMAVALSGAIGALLALVQGARTPALELRLAAGASGVQVEIAQSVVSVPEWAVARFFDAAWTDRPGGYQAAVGLAAARRIVERLGGSLELAAGDRGGCRLVLAAPGSLGR